MEEKKRKKIIRLNLGGGSTSIPGYENIDIALGQSAYPLDYQDETVTTIRASHLLEHFGLHEVPKVLGDWYSKLIPGIGVMKIAVPDIRRIAEWIVSGYPVPWTSYICGGQVNEHDFHKSAFNEGLLRLLLQKTGLIDIQPWDSEIQDCATLQVSLNLMGRRPVEGEVE